MYNLSVKCLHILDELRRILSLNFNLVAGVAQLVEQLTCNQPVGGSTPLASSIYFLGKYIISDSNGFSVSKLVSIYFILLKVGSKRAI